MLLRSPWAILPVSLVVVITKRKATSGLSADGASVRAMVQEDPRQACCQCRFRASIVVGMHDYGTGLDMNSFEVIADFPIDGVPAGKNLARKFKALAEGRWELTLSQPIHDLSAGKLIVAVRDRQGNTSRVERTLVVVARKN